MKPMQLADVCLNANRINRVSLTPARIKVDVVFQLTCKCCHNSANDNRPLNFA